ncbi:unnamed protein product [Owenia fusiformis]|uniref:Methyltransferase type 11 domain-containing protein n=1 Tax=Owenia fusiformis TaxID=6347 RepID=A0A8S4MVE0_OWEFU|nr:unnamed protein product [Owenia fusiformis]
MVLTVNDKGRKDYIIKVFIKEMLQMGNQETIMKTTNGILHKYQTLCTWMHSLDRNISLCASMHMPNKIPKIYLFHQTNGAKPSWVQQGIIIQDLKDLKIRTVKSTSRRPEHKQDAQSFYTITANAYTNKPRVVKIQRELYQKAVQLLNLKSISNPQSKCVLDLGCGIGICSHYFCHLSNHCNCAVIGVDISQEMLNQTKQSVNNGYISLLLNDIGQGLPFKAKSVDAAISISTLQWIMSSGYTMKLNMFFKSLGQCLTQGGRAVIQFYPNNSHEVEELIKTVSKYFNGVLLADFPHNDDAVKLFLCLENPG